MIAALCLVPFVVGIIWLVYLFATAPAGVEIPGVGFVYTDPPKDARYKITYQGKEALESER